MKATLLCDHCWKGIVYPKGEREIPDDLAAALGIAVDEFGESEPPLPFSAEPATVEEPVAIPPKPLPKRPRRKS